MIFEAHLAYPFLLLFSLDKLLGIGLDQSHYLLLLFFSIFPDLDLVVHAIVRRRTTPFPRHHEWVTHWPITYAPLIVALFFFPSMKLAIVVFAIYAHLSLDLFNAGDGMMFFYPVSKKWYSFFSASTHGKHGFEWLAAYKKTLKYKVDMALFATAVLVYVFSFVA